jgi:hypothetical protein
MLVKQKNRQKKLEELKKLNDEKTAAQEVVDGHIQQLDKNVELETSESVNEGKTYRLYMNSDPDEPKEIDYERYFGDGTKAEMIKKAKKFAKDKTNQYGDPIKIAVTAEDDIDDVAWTNESVNESNLGLRAGMKITIENDDEDGDFKAGEYDVISAKKFGNITLSGMGQKKLELSSGALKQAGFTINESLNEGVFTIAGGVVLGILGSVFAYKGLQAAKNIGGAIVDNSINSLMDYKRKLEDEKEFKNKIKPVADRFANDKNLAAMYDELPSYIDNWTDKAIQQNKRRRKAMGYIADYIKGKLSDEELSYFKEISELIRTGKARVGKNTFESMNEEVDMDMVNIEYGFWGTMNQHEDFDSIEIAYEDAMNYLMGSFKFTDKGAYNFLNSKWGRKLVDEYYDGGHYNMVDTINAFATSATMKKYARQFNESKTTMKNLQTLENFNEAAPKMSDSQQTQNLRNLRDQVANAQKGGSEGRYGKDFEKAKTKALRAIEQMITYAKIGV